MICKLWFHQTWSYPQLVANWVLSKPGNYFKGKPVLGRDGAQALYNRSFPLFDSLCDIYAKDRPDGSKDKGPGDGLDESNKTNTKKAVFDIESTTDVATPKRERKRKRDKIDLGDGELGELSKVITSLVDVEKESPAVMIDMKKSFLCEVETDEKRSQIFNVLMGFPELTQD